MIPDLSTVPVRADWLWPMAKMTLPLVDYEPGGAQLEVTGLLDEVLWTAEYRDGSVVVYRDGVAPMTVLTEPGITSISLAFDANTRPHIGYVIGGVGYWRYWDTITSDYAVMELGETANVRAASDVYKFHAQDMRDTWVAYVRDGALRTRIQRDRYTIEYNLADDLSPSSQLLLLGRTEALRMQWRVTP